MRVAIVVPAFPKASETFIVRKVIGLVDRGHDVRVFCQQSPAEGWGSFPELRPVAAWRSRVFVSPPASPRWRALLHLPRVVWKGLGIPARLARAGRILSAHEGPLAIRRLYRDVDLLRWAPDIVHVEFGTLARDRVYLKAGTGARFVVSFRGFDLNYVGLDDPDYYADVWAEADAIHTLGTDLWERAQSRGCPPTKRHALIAPAVDTDEFSPSPSALDATPEVGPLRVLSVGRLHWKKGYEYNLQAIRLLIDRGVDVAYRIVGDGPYLGAVAFARAELGLENRVDLLGRRPSAEVREQLAWADVLLHGAVSEGFCNAVVEAQAMAVPVVCSDADGLSENVADGETGFVVPRRNPVAAADRLFRLASDPSLRRRFGQAGRARVEDRFAIHQQIEAFQALYRGLM